MQPNWEGNQEEAAQGDIPATEKSEGEIVYTFLEGIIETLGCLRCE